jgi:hypothetical protein
MKQLHMYGGESKDSGVVSWSLSASRYLRPRSSFIVLNLEALPYLMFPRKVSKTGCVENKVGHAKYDCYRVLHFPHEVHQFFVCNGAENLVRIATTR